MTPDQIEQVKISFATVALIKDQAATLFYRRLFELDPSLRPMFPDDLAEQKKKLMAAIAMTVGSLDKFDDILPMIRALGQRHGGYGVTPGHYATVGAALLWTLQQCLVAGWTPKLAAAWSEAYKLMAGTMIAAAEGAQRRTFGNGQAAE